MSQGSRWFTPRVLTLITTHRCTAACAHCCFSCSPRQEKAIPIPRLYALVEEAVQIPSLRLIVFTGGECFLLGRHLDGLIAACTRNGFTTRCVTNGSWATSRRTAERRAGELKAAGLGEINFSTGPFHARDVPVERILWGAHACARAGLDVLVYIEAFEGSTFDAEALAGHPLLAPLREASKVKLCRGNWIPNGGEDQACGLSHAADSLRFHSEGTRTPCRSSLAVLSVTPDQDLVTCYGLTLEYIPELHVGSLKDRTLAEAVGAIQPDLLKMWIHAEGPERILDFVRSKDPAFALPEASAHICQTCLYLHANARAREILKEHAGEVEDRVLQAYCLASVADGVEAAEAKGGLVDRMTAQASSIATDTIMMLTIPAEITGPFTLPVRSRVGPAPDPP